MSKTSFPVLFLNHMRKRIISDAFIFSFLFGLSIFLSGCMGSSTPSKDENASASVVEANNQFAFDLYAQYAKDPGMNGVNIFFSPYSITTALAMTYEGANGKTAEEMQSVLHLPKDDAMRRSGYAQLYNAMNGEEKPYKLSTANALWAQNDFKFSDDYFSIISDYYDGKIANLDFVDDPQGSRETINTWVEDQTNDKIQDLIPADLISSGTRLILTNAIYFQGKWVKQFNKQDSHNRDFKVTPDEIVKVKMMMRTDEDAEFRYTKNSEVQILEIPYSGEEISLLILLPNDDITSLEKSISSEKVTQWKEGLVKQRVNIYIPKFKFETKYSMSETLKKMGMPTAFSADADFSLMTGNADLYIGGVIHQAFVEVNEEGTEAAAATAISGMIMAPMNEEAPRIPVFIADHPFIFIIEEVSTGNILFMGRVMDPTKG